MNYVLFLFSNYCFGAQLLVEGMLLDGGKGMESSYALEENVMGCCTRLGENVKPFPLLFVCTWIFMFELFLIGKWVAFFYLNILMRNRNFKMCKD